MGLISATAQEQIVLVTKSGYGKRLPINSMRVVGKGELGTQGIQFPTKQDTLAGIASAQTPVTLLTSQGRVVSIAPESIVLSGKDGVGDRLFPLLDQEEIMTIF